MKEANKSVRAELQNLADKIEKLGKAPGREEEMRKLQKKEKQMLGLIDSYGREVSWDGFVSRHLISITLQN